MLLVAVQLQMHQVVSEKTAASQHFLEILASVRASPVPKAPQHYLAVLVDFNLARLLRADDCTTVEQ